MSRSAVIVSALKRVPWMVWALLAPAVIIGAVQLATGGAKRVTVVGAGPLSTLRADDAPEGYRYDLRLRAHEPIPAAVKRVEDSVAQWPDVLVFALARSVERGDSAQMACAALGRLAQQAENATAVPVVVGFAAAAAAKAAQRAAVREANRCLREVVCAGSRARLCVDIAPYGDDDRGLRQALASAVVDAGARHRAYRASTQVGR